MSERPMPGWLEKWRNDPPGLYRCPECELPEGRRHHADCSLYPKDVVKPCST
jgi:hypothetical protein